MNINLSAPINELSYGLVSRNLLRELDSMGHKVALWPIGSIQCTQEEADLVQRCIAGQDHFDNSAPSLRIYHQFDLAQHVGDGLKVGWPIFELNQFTDRERHHLSSQDALLVCSEWASSLVESFAPTSVCPLGVDSSIFYPILPHPKGGPTTFLNVGKWEIRKGHDILVEAFNAAFSPQDDVRLIMASYNPFLKPEENTEWESYYMNSPLGRAGKIGVVNGRLNSQGELADLMRSVDCGVFPSRAEGWNLPLCEMMAMGKMVIATNYSAHTQFCNSENALLISPGPLERAYDLPWFYGQGQWMSFGQNQFDQLVNALWTVHQRKLDFGTVYSDCGPDFARTYTWRRTAEAVVNALQVNIVR